MSFIRKYRSTVLLLSVLFVLISSPLMDEDNPQWALLTLGMFLAISIGFGGYLIAPSRRWLYSYACAVLIVLGSALSQIVGQTNIVTDIGRHVSIIFIQTSALYISLHYALSRKRGTPADRTISGICGYFLLGLVWARIFSLFQEFDSQAFSEVSSEAELVYYSMVTLTTIGYGDIVPINPFVRILSTFESALGTLYLAVLVALLVSELRPQRT